MQKFMLLVILFLSACGGGRPLSYRCGQINDDSLKDYNIRKGDYFCFSNDIVDRTKSYSKEALLGFTDYAVWNNKFYDTYNSGRFGDSYFVDKQGDTIYSKTPIHVIETEVLDEYEEQVQREQKEKQEKEAERKRQIIKQHPEVRKELKNKFFNMCKYNMQNGRVQLNQNYIKQMCDCLACVYNGLSGEDAVYDYVENNQKTISSSDYAIMMYQHYDSCDRYVSGIADFNPCKWAEGKYPF